MPGILAGNELPGWVDNAGSISRRILVFSFEQVVREKDTQLDSKLAKEIPQILVKANRAYLEMVREVGHDDVWKHVAPYFKRQREEVASSCNPLEDFITSGKLEFDPSYKVPWGAFSTAFHAHEQENSLHRSALKPTRTVPSWLDMAYGEPTTRRTSTRAGGRRPTGSRGASCWMGPSAGATCPCDQGDWKQGQGSSRYFTHIKRASARSSFFLVF